MATPTDTQNITPTAMAPKPYVEEYPRENLTFEAIKAGTVGTLGTYAGAKGLAHMAKNMLIEAKTNVEIADVAGKAKGEVAKTGTVLNDIGDAVNASRQGIAEGITATGDVAAATTNAGNHMGNIATYVGNKAKADVTAMASNMNVPTGDLVAEAAASAAVEGALNTATAVGDALNTQKGALDGVAVAANTASGTLVDASNVISDAAKDGVQQEAAKASLDAVNEGLDQIQGAKVEKTISKTGNRIIGVASVVAGVAAAFLAANQARENATIRTQLQEQNAQLATEEAMLMNENTAMKTGVLQQSAIIEQQAQALAQMQEGSHVARLGMEPRGAQQVDFASRVGGSQARAGESFTDRVPQTAGQSRADMLVEQQGNPGEFGRS